MTAASNSEARKRSATSGPFLPPPTILADNPLPSSVDWDLVQSVLGVRIAQPSSLLLSERKGDLLSAETDEVHGRSEFPNLLRLRGLLEARGLTGPGGDVVPGFVEGFSLGLHSSSSSLVASHAEGSGPDPSPSGDWSGLAGPFA